jgi:hypothetical protein
MQKGEAVACLKAIYNIFPASAVSFERTNSLKGKYQICIDGQIGGSDKKSIKDIAKEHCLEVKEEHGCMIMFTP